MELRNRSSIKPQVVILAGGYGTRIKEYPEPIPKPMVPIGGRPILWHIMKSYSHYGFTDFIICLGYRGDVIRKYFLDFAFLNNDVTIRLQSSGSSLVENYGQDDLSWKVTLVDTGVDTFTGGRIKRVEKFIQSDDFFISYGDTLTDIDFKNQLAFHRDLDATVTITGVNQYSRFGHILHSPNFQVTKFEEKPLLSEMVSGGFFVAKRSFLDSISGDKIMLESEPLQMETARQKLFCYHHKGFWSCMDTYRDYEYLNQLYQQNSCPWMVWTKEKT